MMKRMIVCIALALAGCGDDGDDNDTDTGTDETGTTGMVEDTGTDETSMAGDYWNDGVCNGFWTPSSDDCDDVAFEGECTEDNKVIWCVGEQLYCIDCETFETLDLVCGWEEKKDWYNCVIPE